MVPAHGKVEKFLFFTTFIYIFLFENFVQVCNVSWSHPPTTSLKPPDPLNTPSSQLDVLFLFYNPLSPVSAAPMLMNVRSSIESGQPANVHSLVKKCDSPSLSIWLTTALHLRLGHRETLSAPWWVFNVILLLQLWVHVSSNHAMFRGQHFTTPFHPSTLHILQFLHSLWPLCHNFLWDFRLNLPINDATDEGRTNRRMGIK